MKKLLIGVMALAILAGCKKGENDPGISLRSRDARVVGEWTIASMEMESNTVFGSTTKTITKVTDKFDGSRLTSVTVVNGVTSPTPPNLNTYESKLEITKDGKVKYVETSKDISGVINTIMEEGTWNWLNSAKNKTTLLIQMNGSGNVFSGGIFTVDQLKNKEMIFKNTFSASDKTTGLASLNDSETSSVQTFTLTQ